MKISYVIWNGLTKFFNRKDKTIEEMYNFIGYVPIFCGTGIFFLGALLIAIGTKRWDFLLGGLSFFCIGVLFTFKAAIIYFFNEYNMIKKEK